MGVFVCGVVRVHFSSNFNTGFYKIINFICYWWVYRKKKLYF